MQSEGMRGDRQIAGKEVPISYWDVCVSLHHERCHTLTSWPEGCILQDTENLTGQGSEQPQLTLKSALLLQGFGPDDLQRSVPFPKVGMSEACD